MPGRRRRILILAAAALVIVLIGGSAAVGLYTDALWYGAAGYASVFWKRILAGAIVRAIGTVVGGAIVLVNLALVTRRLGTLQLRRRYGNLEIAEQVPRRYLLAIIAVASVLAGWWLTALDFGSDSGIAVLAWLRHASWGTTDPVFGRDLSFFVFSLPFWERVLDFFLLAAVWSAVVVALGYALIGMLRMQERRLYVSDPARRHLVGLLSAMLVLVAIRIWLGRYEILLAGSTWVGYTDIRARLPAQGAVAVLALAAAVAFAYAGWRARWVPAIASLGALATGALLLEQAYPAAIQKFRVEPNQIASETPYIRWNLELTRSAYALAKMERQPYAYQPATADSWAVAAPALRKLPRWDPEPLRTTFNQVKIIYPYYRFPSVDFDRYGPPGEERQVAVGPRQFDLGGLPTETQTWQTLHLNPRYLQGWGAVVTPADEATDQREPVYWLENLRPVRRSADAPAGVSMTHPGIFFAESLRDYAVVVPGRDSVFTGVPGRDFPAGVELSSLPRLLAFAWRFGEKNLLFSGDIQGDSRIVFRRGLDERLGALARWVVWDRDPLPVLHDGRLVWMVDGYTASGTFPLARAVSVDGVGRVRYMRPSVKATVDAVTGDVAFYAVDADDPILRTFRRVFPEVVRPLSSMPADLQRHLRYPTRMLRIQGRILEEFHLQQPEAFFAGQDVWSVATEAGSEGVPRPYEPSYAMMPLPGATQPEFLLSLPFVARDRHNMTALLIARNDPPHYGELRLLEISRDQQVPGPTQVHSLVEQDPVLSQRLSLWRQGGSDVDVGHLRIVPVDSSLLYVLPLFLSANENAIPQLEALIASDGRSVGMGATLEQAVQALGAPEAERRALVDTAVAASVPTGWRDRALELMRDADARLRAGDFAGFGEAWERLRTLLQQAGKTPPAAPAAPSKPPGG